MPLFEECCVLIPAANLEDFPTELSDEDAQSLLGGWTMLWHPCLLAEMEQLPAWYRADMPPEDLNDRLIAVPRPSAQQLPEDFKLPTQEKGDCLWLDAATRQGFLDQLPWDRLPKLKSETLTTGDREIGVADFFAAAYASLQVQVMTKRLRYTSNLDELHLQNCAVKAAKAFVNGDSEAASESLHDLFDCLAEERDHYFSSDPHLIDLVLTSPSTMGRLVDVIQSEEESAVVNSDPSVDSTDETQPVPLEQRVGACLPTPLNLLVDVEVAESLDQLPTEVLNRFKRQLDTGVLSWAGGGPASGICFDGMTFQQSEEALIAAHQQFVATVGMAPPVYGRFAGATPADLTATLVRLGYLGIMPIDFAGGTGFGDEAKVILQAGGVQLEALTAKPTDASSDASFLTLGTRLGESIDRGEIATGLFAHWPGDSCESFQDLRRVATWSLCLGKFWKISDYFTEGESPYHHGEAITASTNASRLLSESVTEGESNPISSQVDSFLATIESEQGQLLEGVSGLVSGESNTASSISQFASAVGAQLTPSHRSDESAEGRQSDTTVDGDCLLINPVSVGVRCDLSLAGGISDRPDHIYAVDTSSGTTRATVDVPACGFVRVPVDSDSRGSGERLSKRLKRGFFGGAKPIAEKDRLQNEFMEVSLSPKTGAVLGVYSGSRGNRFSLRLTSSDGKKSSNVEMRADRFGVKASSQHQGCLEASGVLLRVEGDTKEPIAKFQLRYTLDRGSRFLRVDGEIDPLKSIQGDPWLNYLGLRMAVASESAICRTIVRDKLHRARSRRLVSPLGLVIDEAERQTLVCGHGLPFHRRFGERFLDTLVLVQGESRRTFSMHYGIDVPSPVAACRAKLSPPMVLPLVKGSQGPLIGWVAHVAPKDILLSAVSVHSRQDGRFAAVVRVIQTQAQTAKVKLRFCRDIVAVALLDDSLETLLNATCEELQSRCEKQSSDVQFDGDLAKFGMHSHGVSDLLVVFA